MSTEHNKNIVRQFIDEVLNTGDISRIADFWVTPESAAQLQRDLPILRRAFPDLTYMVEEQVAEGETVVTRWTAYGTGEYPLFGDPPFASWQGVTFSYFTDGKFTREWVLMDSSAQMQQLHALGPSPIHWDLTQ